MFLLIGESLGWQELFFIGMIALIVFGPRKLPQLARTIGKAMAEFRKVTGEFKDTWQKEVDFDEFKEETQIKSIFMDLSYILNQLGEERSASLARR